MDLFDGARNLLSWHEIAGRQRSAQAMDPAVELRHQVGQLNDTRLSLNDLVIKTAALGLRRSWKRPISLAF